MPNPLPTGGLWCEICKTPRHYPYHCPMMQKYQIVPKSTFCNFCKFVGHEDKDCRALEIIKERTAYAYRMQVELMKSNMHDSLQRHHNIIKYHSIIHHTQKIKETGEDSEEEDMEEEDLEEEEDQ